MEGFLLELPRALLEISLLLAAAVVVGLLARRTRIPLTAFLAVAGLAVVELGGDLAIRDLLVDEGFEELLVNLFLPILIFEAALGLSTREFMRNLVAIVALATVALTISAALVAGGLTLALGIPLSAALLFGVLVSATDPVAVVAIFRELGVSERLLALVEGESMLNDGVAIVLVEILLVATLGGTTTVAEGIVGFVSVFVGGAAIGAVIGTGAVLLLPLLQRLPAAALSVAVAYGAFVLAEAVLGVSGVMATVAAGIAIGGTLESRAAHAARDLLHELWEALSFIANALLFLFIGLALDLALLRENAGAIALAIGAVLVARPLAVVPVVGLLERWAGIPQVGHRNAAVLVWGGLRGGVALALALALPEALPQRDLFVAMTGGVVLATLLLNATTISSLVHALGLDRPSRAEQFLEAVARLLAVRSVRDRLAALDFQDDLVDAHLEVADADAMDELERSHLSGDEIREVLTLRGLHIERETYQNLSDAGLLPPIATRTLMQEIDDEIEETGRGSLDVDAPRRGRLPWYGRLHRRLLGLLPPPVGEDLTEVAYIEVSARRLAAHRAAEELDRFRELPRVEPATVDAAKRTFEHWEEAAASSLDDLDAETEIDRRMLRRRQSKALARITTTQTLDTLVAAGVLSPSAASNATERIVAEIAQAGP
ncbi:MAG: sodium:proton antiporter [Nitriliruptorales bacterium]|nr:sodium:proton antiporter [Nitriliruptorales bacterium]